jgi:tetratricopeptide (TPR) repeat protein
MTNAVARERLVGRSLSRWLWAIAAAVALVAGVDWLSSGAEPVPPADPARERALRRISTGPDRNYAEVIERLDLAIEDARNRAEAADDQWLMHQQLAAQLIERSRLTGSYADAAAAREALSRAFAVAVPGAGPHFVQAALDFRMHRLGAASAQLDRIDRYAVPPTSPERAEQRAMRGDIAFYSGDYATAQRSYEEADALDPGVTDFRLAIFLSRTGDQDGADRLFARIAERDRRFGAAFLAFITMQRGILDLERGRLDDALAHFNEADRMFPGYWLVEEHIAEVMTLRGDLAGAAARYEDIVRRTGHPEFMDALAGIAAERGDRQAEQGWYARANEAWRQRLALFPEASYGHAIDHCAARGDWACALRLAVRNHEARPYGDAKIVLAEALLENGRAGEARRLIDEVLASPWRTAQLHWVAGRIYGALGDAAAAERQRRLALAMNPLAEQMLGS